jgi:imidazolonepropionase-like amidohydrolase
MEISGSINSLVIEDVTVVDATGKPPTPHTDVVVRDGRIVALDACGLREHGHLPVCDGRGRYLIPGMWETQAHLTRYGNGVMEDAALRWPGEGDMEILDANVRSYLRSGFTTVVDLGGPTEVLADLRRRLRDGTLLGARLLYVGRQFTPIGGLPRFGDSCAESLVCEVADPLSAVKALEEMLELGIDAVKINHTPGFLAFGTGWPTLDRPCLTAIIERAHAAGLPVLVHIDTADSAVEVLELGVDGIEHSFEAPPDRLDAEYQRVAQLCIRQGAYWPMTIAFLEGCSRAGDDTLLSELGVDGNVLPRVLRQNATDPRSLWVNIPDDLRAYFRRRFEEAMAHLKSVHDAGVRMTISTDSGNPCTFHGLTAQRELALMSRAGISAHDILMSATRLAAEKFRKADELGTIEVGKRADMVLLTDDPLADIGNVRKIEAVFQDGIAHRHGSIPL